MEPAGTSGAAPASPAFSSPDIEAAVKLAIGPAVHAAVQATLAAMAAAGGAGEGAGGAAAPAAASPEALAEALKPVVEALQEVTQAVRSTEGQLVKVVQDSTQRLLARMDAHALESYNLAVDAHNQAQVAAACFTRNNIPHIAPLLPRKNSAGALPPTGLFPTTVSDLDNLTAPYHSYSATSAEQRNARLVQLLRFYGAEADGKSWPAAEALPDGGYACMEEFGRRAGYLKTFLRLE